MKIRILIILLVASLMLSALPVMSMPAYGASYTDAQWEELIIKFKNAFFGDEKVDWSDPQISAIVGQKNSRGLTVSGIAYDGGQCWRDLEDNREYPNRIFGNEDITVDIPSADMGRQLLYLQAMAESYATTGAEYSYMDEDGAVQTVVLYRNPLLRAAIFYGLEKSLGFYNRDFWSKQMESPSNTVNYNWWDWAYQAPNQIGRTLIALYPYETPDEEEIAITMAETAIDFVNLIRPNDHSNSNTRMENRRSRLNVIPALAAVARDGALMDETKTNMAYFLRNDYSYADGVKQDGSYICHGSFAMEGRYGIDILISRVIDTYSVLYGTAFAPVTSNSINQFYWIMDVFKPIMLDSGIMAQSNGREPQCSLSMGPIVIKGALKLLGCFGQREDLQLKQFIRKIIICETQEDTERACAYYARVMGDVNLVHALKTVVFEQRVAADQELYGVMRYKSDRAVQHREKYTVGLAMSSNRIANYESINGQNRYGWFTGDGMVYVYNENTSVDYDPYGDAFQRYANMYRIPGTTQEAESLREPWSNRMHYFPGMTYIYDEKTGISTWKKDTNVRGQYVSSFVGGTELEGQFIAAAMDFESYSWSPEESAQEIAFIHTTSTKDENAENNKTKQVLLSDLTAKKSYFFFDDEIVCVGTDIDFSTRNGPVYTYVDNRELLESGTVRGNHICGTEDIVVDGILLEKTNDFLHPKTYEDPAWVHQENFGGYFFPQGGTVGVNKTFRTSSDDGNMENDDYNEYFLDIAPRTEEHSFFELWIDHGSKPQNGTYAYVMLPEKSLEETASYSQHPDVTVLCSNDSIHVIRENTLGITAMVFWQAGSYGDITVSQPCILMIREQNGKYTLSVSDPTQTVKTAYVTIRRRLYATDVDQRITVSGDENTYLDLNFNGLGGKTLSGTFTVDDPAYLMFDFASKSRDRYASSLYGFRDYSNVKNWEAGNVEEGALSITEGMLSLSIKAADDRQDNIAAPYIRPVAGERLNETEKMDAPLRFNPRCAEILQLRLKLSDVIARGGGEISLQYLPQGRENWNDGGESAEEILKIEIPEDCLDGGSLENTFVTLTCDLRNSAFATWGEIRGLMLLFRHMDGGEITVDYMYIGPDTDHLLFDFDNGTSSLRYGMGAYGGYDFDAETGAAWATTCTESLSGYYTIDNEAGSLSLYTGTDFFGTQGADLYYGPYLETTANSGIYPWSDPMYHTLSYVPRNGEIVEIRFRTEALTVDPEDTPQLVLLYSAEKAGVTTRISKLLGDFELREGYQIIQMSLPSSFLSADYIKSLGLRFRGVKAEESGSVGKIEIDYIYVGPKAKAPSKEAIFDFGTDTVEPISYASEIYGGIDFRQEGWISMGCNAKPVIDHEEGNLSLTVGYRETGHISMLTSNGLQEPLPLHYNPRNADYIQLKFRLENLEPYTAATMSLYYYTGSDPQYKGIDVSKRVGARLLTAKELSSGQYITMTFPVPRKMKGEKEITGFRIELYGCTPRNRQKPGKITLDYLYIGTKEQLPTPFREISWYDAKGALIRQREVPEGETEAYVGQLPVRDPDPMFHYRFIAWVDEKGQIADASDGKRFPAYVGKSHVFVNGACYCGQKVPEKT